MACKCRYCRENQDCRDRKHARPEWVYRIAIGMQEASYRWARESGRGGLVPFRQGRVVLIESYPHRLVFPAATQP